MLHGFTQTGGCLGPLADDLARAHTVVRPDLPGHGDASALAELDLWAVAAHLATAIGPTLDDPAVWLGYSMGARVALHVALAHPELVSGLVLIGGTAGIDTTVESGDDERAERRAHDDALAKRLEQIGVDAFLDEWLSLPLFEGLPEWARFDDERRRNSVEGLAGSLRHAGTGSMDPLWDRLVEIQVPTLCIAGERDAKFGALAERMSAALPHGTAVAIADAGHGAHLEQPGSVAELVIGFCDRLTPNHATRRNDAPGTRWYQSS